MRNRAPLLLVFALWAILGLPLLLGLVSAHDPATFDWEIAALSFTGLATLGLGFATVWLGATTREIERRRVEESHRPHVVPTAIESAPQSEGRLLPVANVGTGAALNVAGQLKWRGDGSGATANLVPTSIGPGQSRELVVDLPSRRGKRPERVGGRLDYEDIAGGRWQTEFFIDEFGQVHVQRTRLMLKSDGTRPSEDEEQPWRADE